MRYRVQYAEIKPGGHPARQDEMIEADGVDYVVAELSKQAIDKATIRISCCSGSDGIPRQVYPVEPVADFVRKAPGQYQSTTHPEVRIERDSFTYGFSGDRDWYMTQWILLVHGQRVAVRKTLTKVRAVAAKGLGEGRW